MAQIVAQLDWKESQTYKAPLAIYVADLSIDPSWTYYLDGFFQQARIRPFYCSVDNLANQQQVSLSFGQLTFTVNQFSRQTFAVPDYASYCVVKAVGAANLAVNIVFSLDDISKGDTTNLFAVQNATGKQGSLRVIRQVGNGATAPVSSDLGGVILVLNTAAASINLPDASLSGFGSGWNVSIWNDGGSTNNVTITPPGVTTIDGQASLVLPPGDNVEVIADSAFSWHTERISFPLPPAGSVGWSLQSQGAWPIRPKWAVNTSKIPLLSKSASYSLAAADIGSLIEFTGAGPWTLTLLAAATAGNGAVIWISNASNANLTIARSGADNIISSFTNLTSLVIQSGGGKGYLVSDGVSSWRWFGHRKFDSGGQTITSAGSLTLAHNLGVQPYDMDMAIKCTIANAGYNVGDEVVVSTGWSNLPTGVSVVADATNLNIRYASNAGIVFNVLNKGTGANATITAADWNFIIRARVID